MSVLSARSLPASGAEPSAVRRRLPHRFRRLLAPADALSALAVIAVAVRLPDGVGRGPEALLFVPLWCLAVSTVGEYHVAGTVVARIRRLCLVAVVLPTITLLAAELVAYPLSAFKVTAICAASAALGAAGRLLLLAVARHGLAVGDLTHRVVLVGTAGGLPPLWARLEADRRHRFRVVGACVAGGGWRPAGVVVDEGLEHCVEVVRGSGADAVVFAPDPGIPAADARRLCWALEESATRIFVWTGLSAAPPGRTTLDLTDDLAMLHLRAPRRLGATYVVKRQVERVVALLALVLLSPVLLVLVLAIRLDSPGPSFFRQERVGRGDSRFHIWKLRTMTVDAEARLVELSSANEAAGLLFKMRDDPRVTRLGRWLRRTSLDELPQLFNVALGQMSLVGPRPALPSEVEQYPPDVRHRLVVAPGMTGLWQVSGRSDLSWEEAVRLDHQYVDNWTLALDARILGRTVRAVLRRRGAF